MCNSTFPKTRDPSSTFCHPSPLQTGSEKLSGLQPKHCGSLIAANQLDKLLELLMAGLIP